MRYHGEFVTATPDVVPVTPTYYVTCELAQFSDTGPCPDLSQSHSVPWLRLWYVHIVDVFEPVPYASISDSVQGPQGVWSTDHDHRPRVRCDLHRYLHPSNVEG